MHSYHIRNTFVECYSRFAVPEGVRRPASDPTSDSSQGSSFNSRSSSLGSVRGGEESRDDFDFDFEERRPTSSNLAGRRDRQFKLARMAYTGEGERPGNVGHDAGECRPCKYMVRDGNCDAGEACEFCHAWHDPARPRSNRHPCKRQRDSYNKLATQLRKQAAEDPEGFDFDAVALPPGVEANALLRDKLKRKVLAGADDRAAEAAPAARAPADAGELGQLRPDPEAVVGLGPEDPIEYGKVYHL